jgi:hypothetical protein
MPLFQYNGDDERYYPSLSLTVTPGTTAELTELPTDGRWSTAGAEQPALPTAPEGGN